MLYMVLRKVLANARDIRAHRIPFKSEKMTLYSKRHFFAS